MINWQKIFEILPEITGLPFKRKGRHWYGQFYIDGSKSNRWDKTVATLGKDGGGIILLENGNSAYTLWTWLKQFGGCNSDADVLRVLNRDTSAIVIPPTRSEPPSRFVHPSDVKRGDLHHCNLFNYICTIFDIKKVTEAFKMYDCYPVYSKYHGWVTTFLYKDSEGRICFDKQIKYQKNGKRDKTFGGGRFFTTGKGFRNRCYFGSNLLKGYNGKIRVVESEKSAIIWYLEYGTLCLATGGCNNLKEVDPNWILLRDMDFVGEKWKERYPNQCPDWFDYFNGVEEGNDIGDAILKKYS